MLDHTLVKGISQLLSLYCLKAINYSLFNNCHHCSNLVVQYHDTAYYSEKINISLDDA
jgi:hypothetical protein